MNIYWSSGLDPSGYSSCGRSYIKALSKKENHRVYLVSETISRNTDLMGLDKDDLNFFCSIMKNDYEESKDSRFVQHSVPDRFIFGISEKKILYTVVESEVCKRWVDICNRCDIIMTASSFCKERMVDSGINENRIRIIPHCHDETIWNRNVKPLNIENLKGYNFLFIGDYTPRKNGKFLIENFIRTFRGNKDVSLTIKAYYNGFSTKDIESLERRIKREIENTGIPYSQRPTIYFYGNPIYEKYMPRFMSSFDCVISPHRTEGWGLVLSQAMMLGKSVIGTNYGGNKDFMNKENSILIEIDGFEKISKDMIMINPNYEGKEWAILNKDSICDCMKYAVNEGSKVDSLKLKAYYDIKEICNFDNVSDKIIEELR